MTPSLTPPPAPHSLFSRGRELGELRFVKGQSADHRYTLAAAAGNLPTDAHARLVRGAARHGPGEGVSGLHA